MNTFLSSPLSQRKHLCPLFTISIILFIFMYSKVDIMKELALGWKRPEQNSTATNTAFAETRNHKKLVLLYTPLFGRKPWPSLNNDYNFTHWNNVPCEVRNCQISYDTRDLNRSDAVIFHGQDIDHLDLVQLSKKTANRAVQRWVFFLHENPLFFDHNVALLGNVFNWTMTYKLSSDIFVPYSYYFPMKRPGNSTSKGHASENYAHGKDRFVAWMVSHCGKVRDKFVRKLLEFIPVHVYGACSSKFSQSRSCDRRDRQACFKILRRYKFYLAFENAYCVDYITEKYWKTSLSNFIVPVVLGGANYKNKDLAIPGSYVNAMEFSSVKALADYLVSLDKNDTAYNEFFAWRKQYILGNPKSWTCQLCSMVNNVTIPPMVYDRESFLDFWSAKANCGILDKKVEQIIASSHD